MVTGALGRYRSLSHGEFGSFSSGIASGIPRRSVQMAALDRAPGDAALGGEQQTNSYKRNCKNVTVKN
jgi:hypothetical protein